jgi:hypothetical protein
LKARRTLVPCALFSLGLIAGCSGKPAGQATADAAGQPAASHEAAAAPGMGVPGAAGAVVQGTVLETMDAANYTYVHVKTPTGDIWAATLAFKVAVGDTVVVPLENPMANFRSAALKRDFPLIYFASNITRPGEAGQPAAGLPPGHPAAGQAAAAAPSAAAEPTLIAPVAPAPGGTSIANVWANRKALAGKMITVRGKVVKYNGGIMGLNWAHIQDGSGSVKDGTHDLTVTSNTEARVGDVVTVTGTVVADKDFGAGYAYAVMLQGAKITVK